MCIRDRAGTVRFETGDYGHTDLTATVGVPIGDKVKTFIALRSNHVDDWNPTYYTDFKINDGQPLESTVSGSTPDGEEISIDFKSGGKDGVAHRAQDILQINATGTVDLGPLNLRLSAVVDNNTYESNSLPIYYMFNTERLPKSERKLSMYNARANYFLNPNLLLLSLIHI